MAAVAVHTCLSLGGAVLLGPVAAFMLAAALPEGALPIVMVEPAGLRGPPSPAVHITQDGLLVAPAPAVGARKRVTIFAHAGQPQDADVLFVDAELGLALLRSKPLPDIPVAKFASPTAAFTKGAPLTVAGVEGGLPWQTAGATVVGSQTGPWGNFTPGFLTCDGDTEGTGVDAGAAVLTKEGLLAGIHLGRLRVEGAPTQRFSVVGVEKLKAFLQEATLGQPVMSLCVETRTPGATASLDGQPGVPVPGVLKDVPGGHRTLRITAPGHLPEERIVLAALFDSTCHKVDLQLGVKTSINVAAKAPRVSVDGAPSLDATTGLTLPAGHHDLRIEAKGWRPALWSGELVLGQEQVISLPMVREHGLLTLHTQPEGAKVMIEGKDAGVTPLQELKLAPGRWTVELQLPHHKTPKSFDVTMVDGRLVEFPVVKLVPLPSQLSVADSALEGDDQIFLNGQRVTGKSWRVEPGYHDVEIRRPWHKPGRIRLLVKPDEDRVVAPELEPLPEARQRRWKLLVGLGAIAGAAVMGVAGVALAGSAVGMLVGAKLSYDDYHVQTQTQTLQRAYALANGLLWGGGAAVAGSVLMGLLVVVAGGGAGWALFTLPQDPGLQAAVKP